MTDNQEGTHAGDALFEAFIEQVKQVFEHLYDFAYLQQHTLARIYDSESDLSAKTAGRKLRLELINAVESLKPLLESDFRAPNARLYNILHLYYVENLTIQEVAGELGLSERQAYRDLKRGQESVASVLWNNRLPSSAEQSSTSQGFSLETEVARLELRFTSVDVRAILAQAQSAVKRLALQQSVEIMVKPFPNPLIISTDSTLAHQILISLLSYAIQQACPGILSASLTSGDSFVELTLRYPVRDDAVLASLANSPIPTITQRLLWTVTGDNFLEQQECQLTLHMISNSIKILVIDDSDGWVELLTRFLEGFNCQVISLRGSQEIFRAVQDLKPDAIILDVMMPEKDGWELLQRLRAQLTTSTIPIIVCTVLNDPQLAYSLGASQFVPKPANRDHILKALKQVRVIA